MTRPAYLARIADLPHVIYCLSDTHGRPLYVGCTYNLDQRVSQHTMEQPWWHEVAEVRVVTTLPSRTEGLLEEIQQIRKIRPAYNLSMRLPRREWTLDDYLNTLSGAFKRQMAQGYGSHVLGNDYLAREMASRYGVVIEGPAIRDALAYVEAMREERRLSREPVDRAA